MAAPKLNLYYWNSLRWEAVTTNNDASAVIGLELEDSLGNGRIATITISNRAPDRSLVDDEDSRTGPYTDKFNLFKPIILVDDETHMIVFAGYCYEADTKWDAQWGDSIRLVANDALGELRDYPARELGVDVLPQKKQGILYSLANTKQKQIEYLIESTDCVNSKILGVTDVATGTSGATVTKSRNQLSIENVKSNLILEHSQRSVLQTINEIAMDDPHNTSRYENIGFDYYVDPNFTYPKPDQSTSLTVLLSASPSATTVTVASTIGFATSDAIVIGSEQMTITGIPDSTTLTVATRITPTDPPTFNQATTHLIGATVERAWILPNGGTHKQEFNYHKRGTRPLSANFATNGLIITDPTSNSYVEQGVQPRDGTTTLPARRLMLPNSDFIDPSTNLNSHVIVTYNARDNSSSNVKTSGGAAADFATEESDREDIRATTIFELWYTYDFALSLGNSFACFPRFKTHNAKKISTDSNNEVAGAGAAETFSVFKAESGTPSFNANDGSCLALNVGTIQYNSVETGGVNTQAGIEHILVSDVRNTDAASTTTSTGAGKAFPLNNFGTDTYVYIRGDTSGAYCKFNASPNITHAYEGRALNAWNVRRPVRMMHRNDDHPDSLREAVLSKLRRTTKDIRRGSFATTRSPYYYLDIQISSNPGGSGTRQRTMGFTNIDGSTTVPINEYGVRVGMTARFYGTDASFTTEVAHGQIAAYASDTTLTINMNKATTNTEMGADHYVRIYIPVRAGDDLRVENLAQGVKGNHLVTKTIYLEGAGKSDSTWHTVGENNDTDVFNVPGGESGFAGIIDAARGDTLEAETGIGTLGWRYETGEFVAGVSGNNKGDRLEWTTGTLYSASGTETIAAGNTYAKLSNTALSGSTIYYVYYDPSVSKSEFQVKAEASYVESSNKIRILWVRYGDPEVEFGIFGASSPGQAANKMAASNIITSGSISATEIAKNIQPWATNLRWTGTAWNALKWDNGTNNGNGSIEFDDGTVCTINAGVAASLAQNTGYYFYVDAGSSGFLNGQTYSMATPSTTYSDAIGANKVMLATVQTSLNGWGDAPTILPFGSRIPTLNAVQIATGSLTATQIRANTIDTGQIAANAITVNEIASGQITAAEINTSSFNTTGLSAINANIGSITSGTITGTTIQTSANSGVSRYVLDSNDAKFYGVSGDSPSIYFYNGGSNQYRLRSTTGYVYENYFDDLFFWMSTNYHVNAFNNGNTDWGTNSYRWKDGYFAGDVYYNGGNTGSDSRLKSNIVEFTNADSLAFINALTPRKFNKHGGDILHYGLVAQEVEDVLTGLSIDKTKSGLIKIPTAETSDITRDTVDPTTGEITGNSTVSEANMRTLNYEQFIAPLIGAVKELKRRIEILESS